MTSSISWLDYSESDQRQVRELLKLFSDKDTVDDLGIGTIRDAISNQLFPGTSVIQTRARYFLFVPWIMQQAAQRFPDKVIGKSEDMERRLIPALKESDDQDGLIGRVAGVNVRTLPSTIYWNGLTTFGIFTAPGMSRQEYGRTAARRTQRAVDVDGELTGRSAGFWHPELPAPPENFFKFEAAELSLTYDEAAWLRERMLSTESTIAPNLLSSYVRSVSAGAAIPDDFFWNHELPDDTKAELEELAFHAACFSSAVQGASLLYNLMIAQRRGNDDDIDAATSLRERLGEWSTEAERINLADWARRPNEFWASVLGPGRRVPPTTRAFIDEWADLLTTTRLQGLADDERARSVIVQREIGHKRTQARFGNPQRLAAWAGEAGTAPLSYRWFLVRRLLDDIQQGLATGVRS